MKKQHPFFSLHTSRIVSMLGCFLCFTISLIIGSLILSEIDRWWHTQVYRGYLQCLKKRCSKLKLCLHYLKQFHFLLLMLFFLRQYFVWKKRFNCFPERLVIRKVFTKVNIVLRLCFVYLLLFSSVLYFKNWFRSLVLFIISFEIVLFINGKWLSCVHFRFQGAFYSNVSTQILKNSFNLMLLFSETVLDNLGLIRPYTDRLEILIVVVVGVLSILGWNFLMIVFMTVSVILENLTDLSQLLISFGNI